MAITETEMVNAALRKAGGAKRIMAMTDPVGSAGVAQDILVTERDDLLRAGVWNFAVTRAKLAQLLDLPVFGWSFAYALPADCERVVSVYDSEAGIGAIPYKIESLQQADGSYVNAIVTDANTVYLRYCRTITDPNLMTTSFRQVLILRMAKIFAVAISKSKELYAALLDEEKTAMRAAKSIDGIEDFTDPFPEGTWATARRG